MNYKYYLDKLGDYYTDLYRAPINDQVKDWDNWLQVEQYALNGKWIRDDKTTKRLFDGNSNGEFSWISDEISAEKAQEIIRILDNKK